MPVSFIFAYTTPSITDKEEYEKHESAFSCHYGNTENLLVTAAPLRLMSHSEKANGPLHFAFSGA